MLTPFLASLAVASAPSQLGPPWTPSHVPREFRAVWIATVAHTDWPRRNEFDPSKQKAELIRMFDQASALKLNTIIFQVRPAADALYKSEIEPWSVYLTGQQGSGPRPAYDPLAFATEEAHKRGLQIQAWFNPYRAKLLTTKEPLSASHFARTHPGMVKKYGDLLWMDPGEPEVQQRSLQVIEDVVRRYDIDGVHLDDYFYPYPDGGMDFPDQGSYAKYGHGLTKSQWRHENVDNFIARLSKDIHAIKPEIEFGISPFGIYRSGIPAGIKAGVDQYSELSSDPVKWLQSGWCDYLAPQLYWPIAQKEQSFPVLFAWWKSQNTLGRHVWPGLFTSRVLATHKGFSSQEIANQIKITRRGNDDPGHIHFSMSALTADGRGINECLLGQCYQTPVLPPASPWLNPNAPESPAVTCDAQGAVKWKQPEGTQAFWFVVWQHYGRKWFYRILPFDASVDHLPSSLPAGKLDEVQVVAVSRSGIESKPGRAIPGQS